MRSDQFREIKNS